MAKLPVVSGRDVIKVLTKIGFVTDRVKRSHVFMIRKEPKFLAVSVPNHKKLKKGTPGNILNMAELETDDFVKLLK